MVGELADLREAAPWSGDRITQPVLAMVGEWAHDHHRRAAERIPALLPRCRLVEIQDAGHFGPNTNADAVAAALTEFIGNGHPEGPTLGAQERAGAD